MRLPQLKIIRGQTLYEIKSTGSFGLYVAHSAMKNLELPALRDILNGSVGLLNCYNLCNIHSINWRDLMSGERVTKMF